MQDDLSNALTWTSKDPLLHHLFPPEVRVPQQAGSSSPTRTAFPTRWTFKTPAPKAHCRHPIYNNRSHRIDLVSSSPAAPTAARPAIPMSWSASTSTSTSNEAFITYGHAQIADNQLLGPDTYDSFHYRDPGDTTFVNPNNFYSSQWILARHAMLLVGGAHSERSYQPQDDGPRLAVPDLTPVASPDTINLAPDFRRSAAPSEHGLVSNAAKVTVGTRNHGLPGKHSVQWDPRPAQPVLLPRRSPADSI